MVAAVGVVLAWRVELEAASRRQSEEAGEQARLSEEKYRALFENAGDAIMGRARTPADHGER